MSTKTEVEEYYNGFSKRVLLKDFTMLNQRQEAIKKLCGQHVPPGARVLEIGCGCGIITKHLLKIASSVLAIDVSQKNIKIASAYAASPKSQFRVLDVTSEELSINDSENFDVILLADVIEHIPKKKHAKLFNSIEKLLAPEGVVIITYPSPQYQEYLKKNKPETIQIVDETIYPVDLLDKTTLRLHYFNTCNIWCKNQYVHAIFARQERFSPSAIEKSFLQKITYKTKEFLWQMNNKSFLKDIEDVD